MTASSILPAPNLMPLLRYRDLAGAMGWLEQAFGFEKQMAVSDAEGEVVYGQMTYRGSLLMMGAVRDTDLDKLMRQPDEVGGVETQSCYIVVDDADEHYARAQDAGAEVMLDIKSDGLGRRGYSCRDPEGHIWNFGTYNPGRGLSTAVSPTPPSVANSAQTARQSRSYGKRTLMSLVLLGSALCGTCWWYADEIRADFAKRVASAADVAQDAERAYAELVKVRAEKRSAEAMAKSLNQDLAAEKARRVAIEADAARASEKLALEERTRKETESRLAALQETVTRDQKALAAAIEARRVSEEKLAVLAAPKASPVSEAKASEAQTPSEPASPTKSAAAAPDPAQPDAVPSGASGIETSATGIASPSLNQTPVTRADAGETTPAQSRKDDDKREAQPRTAIRWTQKGRKPEVVRPSRFVPTYVVGLHDVPWPYNTWYK